MRIPLKAAALPLLLLAGCQVNVDNQTKSNVDNAAESAGNQLDRAGDAVGNAADAAGNAVERGADKIGNIQVNVHSDDDGNKAAGNRH
jgi:outer membrane murein-binding lipoprotein Lpp